MSPRAALAFIISAWPLPSAAAGEDPLAGLRQVATEFVTAYNQRDAAAIATLFTQDGEMTDLSGEDPISGRDAIEARYEEVFAAGDAPSMALEVTSVRLVADNLAIEDGTVHLTPPGDDPPVRSVHYTAALLKTEAGGWKIASTRDLEETTADDGRLATLANVLAGEWTSVSDAGMRLDLAFGWDPAGGALTGEILTTPAAAEPLTGTIRIAWHAGRRSLVSWIFDAGGGAIEGIWTPTEDGWLVHTEGTTADGENLSAVQKLVVEDDETLIWSASHRVIDGEPRPDNTIRIVRQSPEPSPPN